MRYPIDQKTTENFIGHIIAHDRAQRQLIEALTILLKAATEDRYSEEVGEWYDEAEKLLKFQNKLKTDHETRLFNEKNGHVESHVSTEITDPQENAKINEAEKSFGEELSEEDLAKHFHEKTKKRSKDMVDMSKKSPFEDMTIEQIEEWERKQDNSNDIYKVKARVANLARNGGASLTPVGEMMVNTFVHVVKDLYDFAETIQDKSVRIPLIERIRKHENMPSNLIAATSAGVKVKK